MDDVERMRAFNRRWTEILGLLDQGVLKTEHGLAEARVLFELAQRPVWERQALRERLGMDPSFLSRVVGRLERDGLVVSTRSPDDGRARDLSLTDAGRAAYAVLDARSTALIGGLLAPLREEQRATVSEAMTVLTALLRPDPAIARPDVQLRSLVPGDLGWVVQRHGAIYWDEFGWNADFEALVAKIVVDHHAAFAGQDRAWIATVDGARAGCVFCAERDPDTAQLRILLVEPWARGLGLGRQLVAHCVGFARDAGYGAITLWTNDVLVSARRIYEAAGFVLVDQDAHHSFGRDLVSQNWTLRLR